MKDMQNKIKDALLQIILIIPYIISSIFVFYAVKSNENFMKIKLNNIKSSAEIDNFQFNFLIIIIIILSSIVTLFITYFLLKLIIFIFNRDSSHNGKDIFMSLLISYMITNLVVIFYINVLGASYESAKFVTPFADLIIFIMLYYLNTKNSKNTILLFVAKAVIVILGMILI